MRHYKERQQFRQVGDCGSAAHGAIDFHAWWCLRKQACLFTKKVPMDEKVGE